MRGPPPPPALLTTRAGLSDSWLNDVNLGFKVNGRINFHCLKMFFFFTAYVLGILRIHKLIIKTEGH